MADPTRPFTSFWACFIDKPAHHTTTIVATDDESATPVWIVVCKARGKQKKVHESRTETNTEMMETKHKGKGPNQNRHEKTTKDERNETTQNVLPSFSLCIRSWLMPLDSFARTNCKFDSTVLTIKI